MKLGFSRIWTIPLTLLILLAGHSLNLVLGALGVLVHGVRLNTLEVRMQDEGLGRVTLQGLEHHALGLPRDIKAQNVGIKGLVLQLQNHRVLPYADHLRLLVGAIDNSGDAPRATQAVYFPIDRPPGADGNARPSTFGMPRRPCRPADARQPVTCRGRSPPLLSCQEVRG